MPYVMNPDTTDVHSYEMEIDPNTGEDIGLKKAQDKGYVQVTAVVDPTTGKKSFLKDGAKKAFEKGYVTPEQYDMLQAQKTEDKIPGLASAGMGAAKTMSLGFHDEIGGGIGTGVQAVKDVAHGDFSKLKNIPENYKTERDKIRKFDKESEKENPKSYLAGEMGGLVSSIAGGIASGGAKMITQAPTAVGAVNRGILSIEGGIASGGAKMITHAPTAVGAVHRGILSGAGVGAVTGYGGSESDTLGGDIENAAEGATVGGLMGGAIPVAAEALKPVIRKGAGKVAEMSESISNYLKNKANKAAVDATKLPNNFIDRSISTSTGEQNLGSQLLDNGLVPWKGSAKERSREILEKAGALKEQGASAIEASLEHAEQYNKYPMTVRQLKHTLEEEMQRRGATLGNNPEANQLYNKLYNMALDGGSWDRRISLKETQHLKKQFMDAASDKKGLNSFLGKTISEDLENRMSSIPDAANVASPLEEYLAGKQDYSLGLNVGKGAQQSLRSAQNAGQAGSLPVSKRDVLREFMPSKYKAMKANTLNSVASSTKNVSKVSRALEQDPTLLGRWAPTLQQAARHGESSLGANIYLLSQRDPAFRDHMGQLDKHLENNQEE